MNKDEQQIALPPWFTEEKDLGDKASPLGPFDEDQIKLIEENVSYAHISPVTTPVPLLIGAYNAYSNGCTCGNRYDNNCAHYLSNAFKRQAHPVNFPANAEKCPHGRMLRAKEMFRWFRGSYDTTFRSGHAGVDYGYWFVYQESSDGQGHVCIHRHQGGYDWKGTGNYDGWPVQWHYYF